MWQRRGCRAFIKNLGSIDLLDEAVLHNDNAATHCHSLIGQCNVNECGGKSL